MIALEDIDHLYARARHDQVLESIRALHASSDAMVRRRIAITWRTDALSLNNRHQQQQLNRYQDFLDQVLRQETVEDTSVATILAGLGRYQDLINTYPDQREIVAGA